jgi:type VI secretion system protein ImpA
MIDIEPLLAPAQNAPPAGTDLEYDASFLEFEALARGAPERQFDTLTETPPWTDVLEQAEALLSRSKDLRIAIAYTRAAAHVHGLAGFHAGVRVLNGLVERYWESLYPMLDPNDEDGNDAALRINALAPLADAYTPFAERDTLLHDLRECIVCSVHGETLTVRDMLVAQGKLSAPEGANGKNIATPARVEGMLVQTLKNDPGALSHGRDLPHALDALAAALTERLGAERMPSLAALVTTARHIAFQFGSMQPAATNETAAPLQTPPAARAVTVRSGEIATREDAIALLDSVCAFLERTEPTHPAPLLIRRARNLMGKDFLAVMQDLAPESLAQIHLIAGTKLQ